MMQLEETIEQAIATLTADNPWFGLCFAALFLERKNLQRHLAPGEGVVGLLPARNRGFGLLALTADRIVFARKRKVMSLPLDDIKVSLHKSKHTSILSVFYAGEKIDFRLPDETSARRFSARIHQAKKLRRRNPFGQRKIEETLQQLKEVERAYREGSIETSEYAHLKERISRKMHD